MAGRGGIGGRGISSEEKELAPFLREQRRQNQFVQYPGRGFNMYGGGGIAAGMPANSLQNEVEFLSSIRHNLYGDYYGVNLSPRLRPPVRSEDDLRPMQGIPVGRSWTGAADLQNMTSHKNEVGWLCFFQQLMEKDKAPPPRPQPPVSADWLNEGDGRTRLPPGKQENRADSLQDALKGSNARVPISWSSVFEAFEPSILSCPPCWQSIHGITDKEAAAMRKDPLYIQYSKVAAYTARLVANFAYPSLIRGDETYPGEWKAYTALPQQQQYDPFPFSANIDDHIGLLLESVISNKSGCFELTDIAGKALQFSSDHFGSRFIQKKLETASTEEKDLIFSEIRPHALYMMTHVFGNYVVQKLLEQGSAAQQRELIDQMKGHVLKFSLNEYGCRVVQKAIEVVEMAQKIKLISELDGHVMFCICDQNGNQVIKKCIECIPYEKIHFIISTFYDQVAKLSTHPYGCRTIQKVLEQCDDPRTWFIVMEEIMQSACLLALDQHGNYVVQYVLEHGKPEERSLLIKKLARQIVSMSLQKFASNVVEKCLTFGDPEDRQLLINEMLSSTDQNEPLEAMIKDQYGNYVVQKALEFCNDEQCKLILSKIKLHLNTLQKYTFGKHIVARVEKLIEDGEKRATTRAITLAHPARPRKGSLMGNLKRDLSYLRS